jgi:hypothetical protein
VSGPGFFALMVVLDLVPALVFLHRILARARAAGVSTKPHAGVAVYSGVMAGITGNGAGAWYCLHRMWAMDPVPSAWQTPLVIGSGVFGSAVAAGAVYLHQRLATQRDPDYEEPLTRR